MPNNNRIGIVAMDIAKLLPENIPFHWYGLILGCALVVALQVSTYKAKQHHISPSTVENHQWWIVIGGILGARIWHVLTDWPLYVGQPWQALAVWQGGLSIIGAVAGAIIAGYFSLRQTKESSISFKMMLDIGTFGLPIGQAIGRLANWVNQELYGYPTTLPWGIFIAPENRLPNWQSYTHFHPLFAYEMIVTISGAAMLWWLDSTKGAPFRPGWLTWGSGRWFAGYVGYYAICRIGLDFFRPDKATIWQGGWGSNQVILGFIVFATAMWLMQSIKRGNRG